MLVRFWGTRGSIAKAGEAAGATDWLTRPFSLQYARTRIRAWLLRARCRWKKPPISANDASRIEAPSALDVLDSEAEDRFDRHTRIAAMALEAPFALVG